jgi:hypothetical protein
MLESFVRTALKHSSRVKNGFKPFKDLVDLRKTVQRKLVSVVKSLLTSTTMPGRNQGIHHGKWVIKPTINELLKHRTRVFNQMKPYLTKSAHSVIDSMLVEYRGFLKQYAATTQPSSLENRNYIHHRSGNTYLRDDIEEEFQDTIRVKSREWKVKARLWFHAEITTLSRIDWDYFKGCWKAVYSIRYMNKGLQPSQEVPEIGKGLLHLYKQHIRSKDSQEAILETYKREQRLIEEAIRTQRPSSRTLGKIGRFITPICKSTSQLMVSSNLRRSLPEFTSEIPVEKAIIKTINNLSQESNETDPTILAGLKIWLQETLHKYGASARNSKIPKLRVNSSSCMERTLKQGGAYEELRQHLQQEIHVQVERTDNETQETAKQILKGQLAEEMGFDINDPLLEELYYDMFPEQPLMDLTEEALNTVVKRETTEHDWSRLASKLAKSSLDDHPSLRTILVGIKERGSKVRTLCKAEAGPAALLYFAQAKCVKLLKSIPGLMEQYSQDVQGIQERLLKGRNHGGVYYESDCTDATDNINSDAAECVIEALSEYFKWDEVIHETLLRTVRDKEIWIDQRKSSILSQLSPPIRTEQYRGKVYSVYSQKKGTQMGLKCSFTVLSLLHLFATQWNVPLPFCDSACVHGDDLLAAYDDFAAERYVKTMTALGFIMNEAKRYTSTRWGLFCGEYYRTTKHIQPIPIRALVAAKTSGIGRISGIQSLDDTNSSKEFRIRAVNQLCHKLASKRQQILLGSLTEYLFPSELRAIQTRTHITPYAPEIFGGFGLMPYRYTNNGLVRTLRHFYNNSTISTKARWWARVNQLFKAQNNLDKEINRIYANIVESIEMWTCSDRQPGAVSRKETLQRVSNDITAKTSYHTTQGRSKQNFEKVQVNRRWVARKNEVFRDLINTLSREMVSQEEFSILLKSSNRHSIKPKQVIEPDVKIPILVAKALKKMIKETSDDNILDSCQDIAKTLDAQLLLVGQKYWLDMTDPRSILYDPTTSTV